MKKNLITVILCLSLLQTGCSSSNDQSSAPAPTSSPLNETNVEAYADAYLSCDYDASVLDYKLFDTSSTEEVTYGIAFTNDTSLSESDIMDKSSTMYGLALAVDDDWGEYSDDAVCLAAASYFDSIFELDEGSGETTIGEDGMTEYKYEPEEGFPKYYGKMIVEGHSLVSLMCRLSDDNDSGYLASLKACFDSAKLTAPEEEEEPIDKMKSWESGQHKVGKDIPAGEYVILAEGGSGYAAITSDANGDDIIANTNFEVNTIFTVKKGEYLELSDCTAYKAKTYWKYYTVKYNSGSSMIKVGKDIKPGEYKLKAGGDGYYCIYDSSRQQNIVSNDNFTGSRYVTVKSGQYLELNDCKLKK